MYRKIIEFLKGEKHILSFSLANQSLSVLLFITLFLVPVMPSHLYRFTYSILFSGMILLGTQLISNRRKMLLLYASTAIVMVWIGDAMDLPIIMGISKGINIILYVFIVINLVRQASEAKTVSPTVILESINAYLMIGLVFSVMVALMTAVNSGSFSFNNLNAGAVSPDSLNHEIIYYTFITLTTVGYGDVVPLTSEAKSLAMMICVTGQLYIAVVIALLVGKYISQRGSTRD
jgi:voltage-gated potassium channel